jgi:excisionase family DNA binding protein
MDGEPRALLKTGDVARLFNVDPKTVTRWAHEGLLSYFLTPGGQHRFYADEVNAQLQPTRRERNTP